MTKQRKILMIDDEKDLCVIVTENLRMHKGFEAAYALTEEEGIKLVRSFEPDIVFLDVELSEANGLDIIRKILKINKNIRIIVLSGKGSHEDVQIALEYGAVDFITKPCNMSRLIESISKSLSLGLRAKKSDGTTYKAKKFSRNLFLDIFSSFIYITEAKSKYLKGHSHRVAKLSKKIGREMGLDASHMEILEYSAIIHDLGKIGIKDAILEKKGKLTKREWEIMKRHPVVGSEIINKVRLLHLEEPIVKSHHERFDGAGYPKGLKGGAIPLEARIIALSDSYDAMTSSRAYRKKIEKQAVIAEISKNSGTQFDPNVVSAFLKVISK